MGRAHACLQRFHRNQGSFARGFRPVNHQILQGDMEDPGVEPETRDFHLAAAEPFQAGDYTALQRALEPCGAHENQADENQPQQTFHQDQDEPNGFGYFPMRTATSS